MIVNPEIMQLTLIQPWATLMAINEKGVETRSWATKYKGWVAIHAGKSTNFLHLTEEEPYRRCLARSGDDRQELPLGAIVAVMWLNEVITSRGELPNRYLHPHYEELFGDYTKGRKLWLFDRSTLVRLSEPLATRGYTGMQPVAPGPEVYGELRKLLP